MNSKNSSKDYFLNIGEHKIYKFCRFCKLAKLIKVIDLGTMPLAGGFIEKKNISKVSQLYYPLTLGFCNQCKMLQTIETVNENTLFEMYYYATSKIKTLTSHFEMLADEIASSLKTKNALVVEIGSNDGVLIQSLVKKGIWALGVDPAKNLVLPKIKKGLPLLCDYFNVKTAKTIIAKHKKADVITSSNTMAHIEDIDSVYKGIKLLLNKDGYAIIEVHYLQSLISEFQYDMIYHEHLYYYSVYSMQRILRLFGLELFDVAKTSIHAGSVRFFLQHQNGPRKISKNVQNFLRQEQKTQLFKMETFLLFNEKMKKKRESLLKTLKTLKLKSKTIAGYGASGRANTIMGYSKIGTEMLDYIVDDSPLKQGRYTPGNNLQIINSKILNTKKRPDYLLLFAWAFYDEIVSKNSKYLEQGGKFILPLPQVKIVK